jgi:hypothetical protein
MRGVETATIGIVSCTVTAIGNLHRNPGEASGDNRFKNGGLDVWIDDDFLFTFGRGGGRQRCPSASAERKLADGAGIRVVGGSDQLSRRLARDAGGRCAIGGRVAIGSGGCAQLVGLLDRRFIWRDVHRRRNINGAAAWRCKRFGPYRSGTDARLADVRPFRSSWHTAACGHANAFGGRGLFAPRGRSHPLVKLRCRRQLVWRRCAQVAQLQ